MVTVDYIIVRIKKWIPIDHKKGKRKYKDNNLEWIRLDK